ncbi:thiamine pyrophosphate protein central region [Beutenbergia cavernae DSM 12333]|uniref:Thiamine pyrophosphate protein central region n=1 Tax=Beutenbergia cavernae (strain ATCC BAA-8 / DSM 12333 / CCUG 43141 / JCM 11478 / NBRC 16432 / NCIMB 13614 / HKI 0122) TaxID=471853 RepID=C5BYN1_BEUC1|nr:3D-(3,5/4)-trihydroxycyclohexane-1,2-dione acylhydrolase (decyclizing) [Beutenbergia cavernae]ACQ78989.1 thiamine pyrophosphate protein central region [Beutenbergia cavernae DSM 12333]
MTSPVSGSVRLTVAQALVRFLSVQYSERDGVRQRLVPGCFGIFGHGNVAGVGQALLQHAREYDDGAGSDEPDGLGRPTEPLTYYLARNEQAMVHAAVGFARTRHRLQAMACAASIGPGSTNMLTGAALATIDRIPVLLLPSDTFATRIPDPVLQQLEVPSSPDVSVNDAFRPLSRYWDRITRPEQLIASLPAAMRVLADPAETGAVTLCLPQDVQAEAHLWPVELFRERTWHVARAVPEPAALERAAALVRSARRPLVVAGGGVRYSTASGDLTAFADATGIPVVDTQAGKGAIAWDHPLAAGGVGATGNAAANALAAQADVVIGVGTRYTDFTTASHTVFADPDVRFVNLNVAAFDAAKHSAEMVVADARAGLTALTAALEGYRTSEEYRAEVAERSSAWHEVTEACYHADHGPLPAQTEVFGVLNELMGPDDVLINAAGSMPGDLQALWRASSPEQYHLEYGYSCMGYEIPAALGVKLAAPEREVVAVVGDGGYQMLPTELTTIVSEGLKVVLVVLQNHGFASIGALSESVGSQRFGTRYRMRDEASGALDGGEVPFDVAANAASLGARVVVADGIGEFRSAFSDAAAGDVTTVIVIETDLTGPNPPSSAWWDVPVSEVSTLESTRAAYSEYVRSRAAQRPYL